MALIFDNGLESGTFSGWTDQSAAPPTIGGTYKHLGNYGARLNIEGASWTRRTHGSGVVVSAIRFYLYIETVENSTTPGLLSVGNAAVTKEGQIRVNVSAGGVVTLSGHIYDGVTTFNSAISGTIPQDTWVRIEVKLDLSGASAKLTWGWAVGDDALTTIDTDFTGGNAWGAADYARHYLFGDTGFHYNVRWIDDFAVGDAAADYPIGAPSRIYAAISALSPVSYWKLDYTGSTPVFVDEVGGISGNPVNSPAHGLTPITPGDRHGKSVRIDNADGDAISFGNVYDFVGSAQFTVLAFLKPIAYNAGSGHSIWSNEDVSSRGWSLRLANPAVRWTMSRGDNAGFDNVTYDMAEAVYENGSIVRMVAMRYDGTNLILHMNGDDVAQGLSSKTLVAATTNTSLRFGSYSGGGSGYDGYADDLVIWDRCLSLAELRTIWNASYPRADVALRGL